MKPSNISFVIPAYNAEKTLTESVESIFANNFEVGDEVIIVDDYSTDNTHQVINDLTARFSPHIKAVKNEINKGCPATRNVGINLTKNELIFNLDADNILVPNTISKLKNALLENQADMVSFAEYHYFVESTKLVTHIWTCLPGWLPIENLFAGHINPGPGGNFLYTKASWRRIGGYWEYGKGLHEAWGFTLKQLMAGSKLFVVAGTFYFHRHGHDSLFVTESKNKTAETAMINKMLEPYQDRFDASDWSYMKSNPNWYHNLDKHPIKVDTRLGKDGEMNLTWYGIARKVYRKIFKR